MAYGRRLEEWDQTSLLAALVHNGSAGATEALQPDDYHPLRATAERPDAGADRVAIRAEDVAMLFGGKLEVIK